MAGERIRIKLATKDGQTLTVHIGKVDANRQGPNDLPGIECCITDDVLKVSDAMTFSVSNIAGESIQKFYVGQKLTVEESHPDVANGQWCPQFTGRVVRRKPASSLTNGSILNITCMDLGWHLTRCCARPFIKTNGQQSLGILANKMLQPSWGLSSTTKKSNAENARLKQGRVGALRAFQVQFGQVLPNIQVEPGQKPWDVLATYCERAGVLLNVGAKGELIFFQPNFDQPSAHAIHYHAAGDANHPKNNVEKQPELDEAIDGVYSEVRCFSTVLIPPSVQDTEDPNAQYRWGSYKPEMNPLPFYRLEVFSDSEAINEQMRKNRAAYHAQLDQFNSWTYTAEVSGHVARPAKGSPLFFTSDMMVDVDDSVNGVEAASYYVQSVQKTYSLNGTFTKLTIRKPVLNPNLTAQVGGGAKRSSK